MKCQRKKKLLFTYLSHFLLLIIVLPAICGKMVDMKSFFLFLLQLFFIDFVVYNKNLFYFYANQNGVTLRKCKTFRNISKIK